MAGCRNCSATFDLNGQSRLAEINSNKSLSLREVADATRRVSASAGNSFNRPLTHSTAEAERQWAHCENGVANLPVGLYCDCPGR
jgi:hypothetical protein